MKNETIANWLIISIVACVIGGLTEAGSPDFSAFAYLLGGIGIWVFGIWAVVRLKKTPSKK